MDFLPIELAPQSDLQVTLQILDPLGAIILVCHDRIGSLNILICVDERPLDILEVMHEHLLEESIVFGAPHELKEVQLIHEVVAIHVK